MDRLTRRGTNLMDRLTCLGAFMDRLTRLGARLMDRPARLSALLMHRSRAERFSRCASTSSATFASHDDTRRLLRDLIARLHYWKPSCCACHAPDRAAMTDMTWWSLLAGALGCGGKAEALRW